MKRLLFGALLGGMTLLVASPTTAGIDIHVGVSIPPPIVFAAPPRVVVIPETYVYAVPDLEVDIFFYDGWWWRPWHGGWYRSRDYDSGWIAYRGVPAFHRSIPPGWRKDYWNRSWNGHPWRYSLISERRLQQNWKSWQAGKHWEKQNNWGVQGRKPGREPARLSTAAEPSKPAHREKPGRGSKGR